MEGKSICDALGNLPKNAIMEAIAKGEYIFSGSREFVLFLARKKPTPGVSKAKKEGWWAVERIFYGFFEHAKFTKLVVPTADGFVGSHETHMFAGTCKDAEAARRDGLLTVRAIPCACPPCTQLRFHDCEMKALLACKDARTVKTPRAASDTAGLRLMESLQAWAAALKARQLVGVRVERSEQSLEGAYWLAVLKGKPFEATEDMLHGTVDEHSTPTQTLGSPSPETLSSLTHGPTPPSSLGLKDHIEKGYLVVKAQWLKLKEKNGEGGRRSYTLLDAEVLLVVNHIVRLNGVQFDAAKGGPAGRELRAPKGGKAKEAWAKVYYISREMHHALLSCCM